MLNLIYLSIRKTSEKRIIGFALVMSVMVFAIFFSNVKNIYAGFIESAVSNMTVFGLIIAQIFGLADVIRIIVMNDDDMQITLYSIIIAIAFIIQLSLYIYNIYKCYRFSYTCVPDGSYTKEKGQLFATIGCRAKF